MSQRFHLPCAPILALSFLAALATPIFPSGGLSRPSEANVVAPDLPSLPSAFRAELETVFEQLPSAELSTTEELAQFAELVQTTPHLTDVGRATFLEWIALVHRSRDNRRKGLAYAHEAYRLRRRALGPSHPQCAESLRLIESLQPHTATDAQLASKPTEPTPVEVTPEWLLAVDALHSGAPDRLRQALAGLRAELIEREALAEASERARSDDRARRLMIARVLLRQDQAAQAEPMLKELTESEQSRCTIAKPATLLLADLHYRGGQLRATQDLLDRFETPADDSEAIELLWRRARLESALGEWQSTEQRFVEALDLARKLQPRNNVAEVRIRHELAEFYLSRRVYKEAFHQANAAATQRELLLGEFHRDTRDSRRLAARALGKLGEHMEASERLSQLLELARQAAGPQACETLQVQLDLACTLSESPEFEQNQALASELFARASFGFTELFGEGDARALTTDYELGLHRLREGRPSAAAKLLRRVVEGRRKLLGDSNPATLQAVEMLASVLDGLGFTSEAVGLLKGSLVSCRAAFDEDHPLTIRAVRELCEHYRLHDQVEEEQRVLGEQAALLELSASN